MLYGETGGWRRGGPGLAGEVGPPRLVRGSKSRESSEWVAQPAGPGPPRCQAPPASRARHALFAPKVSLDDARILLDDSRRPLSDLLTEVQHGDHA